jgi:hypothetical protein
VGELSAEEARYLLHKLLAMTVNQTCLATQKEGRIRHVEKSEKIVSELWKNCLRTTSEIWKNCHLTTSEIWKNCL